MPFSNPIAEQLQADMDLLRGSGLADDWFAIWDESGGVFDHLGGRFGEAAGWFQLVLVGF